LITDKSLEAAIAHEEKCWEDALLAAQLQNEDASLERWETAHSILVGIAHVLNDRDMKMVNRE
jgi:hypothetical protein